MTTSEAGTLRVEDFPNKARGAFVYCADTEAKGYMRRMLVSLTLWALALAGEATAEVGATTFYVQLVRGTETEQPPGPGFKSIGPKLTETFRPVFKCRGYWEINRLQVAVRAGQVARVRLGNGREAEIDMRSPRERKVAAFQEGKVVDRTTMPKGEGMTIIGGSREDKSVWFIVVRRDKPPD